MMHKVKALGAALVVLSAASALSASPAGAVALKSSAAHTILTLTPASEYTFSAGSGFGAISCEAQAIQGTMASAEETGPTFFAGSTTDTGCADSLGRDVHLKCTKDYHTDVTFWTGNHHVSCAGDHSYEVTNGSKVVVCTVKISNQTSLGPLSYSNLGNTIEIKFAFNNVKSTIEGGFFNCGTSTTNATAGTFTGTAILSGVDTSGKAVQLRVE